LGDEREKEERAQKKKIEKERKKKMGRMRKKLQTEKSLLLTHNRAPTITSPTPPIMGSVVSIPREERRQPGCVLLFLFFLFLFFVRCG
jgi:hypothetical protein